MDKLTVIVTGASSGIGQVIAEAYLERGATVVVCARRIEKLQHIYGSYSKAEIYKVDVSDAQAIKNFVQGVEQNFRGIDVLLNNAAVLSSGKVEDMDPSDWSMAYRVNVEAPFLFCKYVLPGMKARNFGRIINMSSGGSVACAPEYSLYSSTKAALNAFTKALGRELEGSNVKANAMSPGPCKTDMFPDNPLSPDAAVPTAVYLATLKDGGPNGQFFWMEREVQIIPDFSHVNWADPNSALEKEIA